MAKNNDELLSTVSRIVSNTESAPNERPTPRRQKPNVVQFTLWIHIISIGVTAFVGIADIFPAHGTVKLMIDIISRKIHTNDACAFSHSILRKRFV